MKKVININFQGRVIPIEESAYDILKQYVGSLRRFFANEEGRDEIISDIEDRIAELFTETLKKGSSCITDDEVNIIIASMGRPEDFEAEESNVKSQLGGNGGTGAGNSYQSTTDTPRGRLFRDDNDKILSGFCGGLANYLRIDSSIVRVLYTILTIGSFGTFFLLYILMWIAIPSRTLDKSLIKKRLFRNPEDRIIAGVAGGLAAYFNINVWLPRFIFAIPLILGVISSVFNNMFGNFDGDGFSIIFGSFGSTFFIVYVILWAVIPEANTASEKLEMRGEKVDLNTIKNTIQEDLSGFKARAEKWGKDVGERATQFGDELSAAATQRSAEAGPAIKRGRSRLANAIGVLFKAFFLFLAGVLAFALLIAVLGMLIGGVSVFQLKDFMLEGFTQNFLALATIVLFIGIPIIGLITWILRRVMKVRSKSPYLGYAFGGLWTIGLICAIFLAASIYKSFRKPTSDTSPVAITQPSSGNMLVRLGEMKGKFYSFDWDDDHGDSDVMLSKKEDSMLIRNIGVQVAKSNDSAYHVYLVRYSRGSDVPTAEEKVQRIRFDVVQKDSILELQKGFAISKDDKFRFQRVAIIIEVPVGKKIHLDRSLRWFDWFDVHFNDRGYRPDYDRTVYNWRTDRQYIMTASGLEPLNPPVSEQSPERKEELEREREEYQRELDRINKELKRDSNYRYRPAPATNNGGETNNTKPQARLDRKSSSPSYLGDLMMIRFGS